MIEGAIDAVGAPDTIVIAGQLIRLNAGATIRAGSMQLSFADLRAGLRARAPGERDSAGALRSSLVEVLDAVGVPASTHGIIQGFSGDGNDFQFRFGSQVVRGDANTRILDRGQQVPASALRDGVSSDVTGTQLSDHLQASTIAIDSSTAAGPPAASPAPSPGPSPGPGPGSGEITITGVLGPIAGACPVLSFPISGQAVVTNSATAFVGGSCEGLTVGGSAQVTGTPSGDVFVARTVTVK
jgi:hypothetical protein